MIYKKIKLKVILLFILLAIFFNSLGQNNFVIKQVIITNVKCNGGTTGSIRITEISGGIGPFQYSIDGGRRFQPSNTFNNLRAGLYNLVVMDSLIGRSTIISKVITEPSKLEITSTVNHITCNGFKNGKIHAIVTGGKQPYLYSWSNITSNESSVNGLSAGTYTVTVSDSARCIAIDTIKITEPGILVATASGTNLLCGNDTSGTVSVSVTGGTGPYFYRWNTGTNTTSHSQTGLSAGTYTVTIIDSTQCIDTSSVTLTQMGSLTKKYSIGDTTSCGIVFYIDTIFEAENPCSSRYLICAFEDQNPAIPWYNGTYITTNSNIDMLFDKSNADQIINVQGDSVSYAANVCSAFRTNDRTCTGWYLPSKAELKLIYTNLIDNRSSPIEGFSNEGYWSSLEKSKRKAWLVDFLDGRMIVNNKANKYHVRAIREYITQ